MSDSASMFDQDRLADLIGRHLVGILDASESQELESILSRSAAAREAFRLQCSLDSALRQQATGITEAESPKMTDVPTVPFRRAAWFDRPAVAAAMGLMVGLLSASLAWAYVAPHVVVAVQRLFAIHDGSFEGRSGRLPTGFPTKFGSWSGDEAEVVEMPALKAKDGKQVLRFVRAEREPALPNYGAGSCDVYQLVDLRSLKAEAAASEATLELSVPFLDARSSAGANMKFICRLYAFSGAPDSLPAEWPLSQKESLAAGSAVFDSVGGSPTEWRTLTTKVLLPPQADFAVVHLLTHNPDNPTGVDAVFGKQFADDVRLTLHTHR